MRRVFGVMAIVFALAFANSTGVTRVFTSAVGIDIPVDFFTIPGVPRLVHVDEGAAAENADRVAQVLDESGFDELPGKLSDWYAQQQAATKALQDSQQATSQSPKLSEAKQQQVVDAVVEAISAQQAIANHQPKKTDKKTAQHKPSTNIAGIDPVMTAPAFIAIAESLPVKGRAAKTGYTRDRFGSAWTDAVSVQYGRNGCDTRNDILKRDLTQVVFTKGSHNCKVASGVLPYEPYLGVKNVKFVAGGPYENQLDAEHIVALSDAWQKGGQSWSQAKRTNFANDPINLMMVDPSSNRQKGDADVATWLPKNKNYRCEYVTRVVNIKATYGVWVTKAEQQAMIRELKKC